MNSLPFFSKFLDLKKLKVFLLLIVAGTLLTCKSSTGTDEDDEPDVDLNGYNETTFFRADGPDILNRQGQPVIIKGFGLGGWLLPEGYMFGLNRGGYTSVTDMRNNMTDLIGASDTEDWFQLFRDNYVQEKDVIQMKEWGADHLRFPFHYDLFYDIENEVFIDEGFDRLDQFLIWCKRHRVDVILDMHAAPGGQNDGDISDSDGTARLWTETETYWPPTVKIWKEIARRYKDETIIIGYDLINEPVTPSGVDVGNPMLAQLYLQLADAIREVDKNHILFIEGNYYATTFDYLTPPLFDIDNMVYAFHKYWNETDQGTIQYLLDIRSTHNIPLWLGESGENSNPWFHETTQLMEDNGIGWNWWTHKKLETITSPLSAPTNDNYEKVKNYWNGSGARPSAAEARQGLFQMAEDLDMDKNTLRPDVVAALFSPSFETQNVPYTELTIPGKIDAVNFDIGDNGVSYNDLEYKRVSSDDEQNNGNNGWSYRNDGVDIQPNNESVTDYNIGWTETGEWLEYTVEVTAGTYDITARISSGIDGSRFRMQLNGTQIGSDVAVPNTGGYETWQQVSVGSATFPEGTHTLKLLVLTGGFNISLITIQ